MSVIAFVLYVALGIVAVSVVPGIFLIAREVVRRWRAKRALERLVSARKVIDELRQGPSRRLARTLSQQFDRHTVEVAIEEALGEEAVCADVCERLGLRQSYERSLRNARAWNERAHAARMLGKLRASTASRSLVEALVDPNEDTTVRLAACEAISSIMDAAVVPHLCHALASYDDSSAPTVAEALVSYGEIAVGPVIDLLGDSRPAARTWAARVLGRIGHPRATLPLVTALDDADSATRAAAAEAIGRIGDVRGARALSCVVLTDPSPPVRACASSALAKTGDKEAAKAIVVALRDPDAEVRSRAAEAIAALAPDDRSVLERALFDPSEKVRRSAALSLDRLGAVATWAKALGSPAPEARAAARTALLAVARAGLTDAIHAAATNQDPHVREALVALVRECLAQRQDLSPWVVSARRSSRLASRLRALRELGTDGTPDATAALAEALVSDPSSEARALAARGLSGSKDSWLSGPALSRALSDPAHEVATEAAHVLAQPQIQPQIQAQTAEKRDRRISEFPADPNGLRRTTGRLRREAVLAG